VVDLTCCPDLRVLLLLIYLLSKSESFLVVDFLVVQISFLCYHCLLEGFLLGLFSVMTMVYCCFIWGLLSMEKLSHSSL
jgi:hypothetical protein